MTMEEVSGDWAVYKEETGVCPGYFSRPTDDPAKGEQWDAYNNLVIAWLMNAVSDMIARSVLYVQSATEVRIQL